MPRLISKRCDMTSLSPPRNPNSPRTPEEIAADAIACIDAGAAIVHNHIDVVMVPGEESAARYLEGWRPVFKARPDALIYPTTNFGPGVEGAYSHMEPLAASGLCKIGIIDPGSVNFGGVDAEGLPEAPGVGDRVESDATPGKGPRRGRRKRTDRRRHRGVHRPRP